MGISILCLRNNELKFPTETDDHNDRSANAGKSADNADKGQIKSKFAIYIKGSQLGAFCP